MTSHHRAMRSDNRMNLTWEKQKQTLKMLDDGNNMSKVIHTFVFTSNCNKVFWGIVEFGICIFDIKQPERKENISTKYLVKRISNVN